MKRLMKKFEDIMVAITFAESGEHEISKEALGCKEEICGEDEEVTESISEPETV
jgi:hypothetical protein